MSIPKELLSEVLEKAKINKKILIISDDFGKENFETLKELMKDGNYFYGEESNYFSFDIDLAEDFEDIRDKPYLRKYDIFLIDYGLVGDDEDNLKMIKNMCEKSEAVIWCGGLDGKYCEDAKRMFPKRTYMHDLPECSIRADEIKFCIYRKLNLGVYSSKFLLRAIELLYTRLRK